MDFGSRNGRFWRSIFDGISLYMRKHRFCENCNLLIEKSLFLRVGALKNIEKLMRKLMCKTRLEEIVKNKGKSAFLGLELSFET